MFANRACRSSSWNCGTSRVNGRISVSVVVMRPTLVLAAVSSRPRSDARLCCEASVPPALDADAAGLAPGAAPAVRALARRDLLGDLSPPEDVMASPIVRGLLARLADRAALAHPYRKRTGAHWRLVSLV